MSTVALALDNACNSLPVRLVENPHGPVSLWTLLTLYAASFARSISLLSKIQMNVNLDPGRTPIPSPTLHRITSGQFVELSEQLESLTLKRQSVIAKDIADFMVEHQRFPSGDTLDKLWTLILHDLEKVVFIPVGQNDAALFESATPIFGPDVHAKFPSSNFDISEAGTCFSIRRWNACVYHLMRALEIPLACLAARFGVVSDHTNWHNIIEGIEKAVRGMSKQDGPDWKGDQEFYSQACSQFMVFKDAWRNYTAHARSGKYDEREAYLIKNSVMNFMMKLAHRLHE